MNPNNLQEVIASLQAENTEIRSENALLREKSTIIRQLIGAFKEMYSYLIINPISAFFYTMCVIAIWMTSVGTIEYVRAAVLVFGCLTLLRMPFPIEIKKDQSDISMIR